MESKIMKLDQLSEEQLKNILSSSEGLDRILSLQDKTIPELREMVEGTWLQIKDKEEAAARWLGVLIVLGLMQLYPFSSALLIKCFLVLTLPSFIIAFYSVALTLSKHPNYLRKDFFVSEDADKKTRYIKNKAEVDGLKKIYSNLYKNYERKRKFSSYIGPSVIVNFSVGILFVMYYYIFDLAFLSLYTSLLLAVVSVGIIYVLKKRGSRSTSYKYEFDELGNEKH